MGKWIEVLKTGTFIAKNGKKITITKEDLKNIAMSNPVKDRKTPLVFGHPEDDEPAFGWLRSVKIKGEILLAQFSKVPKAVKQVVKDGYYKKVSVALMPDKKTLRHIGLLGAVQPAVSGLADVAFSDEDEDQIVIEFSGDDEDENEEIINNNEESEAMSAELQKKLDEERKAREAADKKAEKAEKRATESENALSAQADKTREEAIEEKISKIVGKKVLPKHKDLVKKIALSLAKDGDEIELSEGTGKKLLSDHFFDYLSDMPDLGLMTEFSDQGDDGDGKSSPISVGDMLDKV